MIIYIAIHKEKDVFYIGKTTQLLEKRIKQHNGDKRKYPFLNAIRKYGIDGFNWKILFKANNKNQLARAERFFIRFYKSLGYKLYNLHEGGFGGHTRSFTPSQETRKKISDSLKKRYSKEKHHMCGRKTPKKVVEKRKKSISGENNYKYDYTIYTFQHLQYGIHKCTQNQLYKKFNLDARKVNLLIHKKRKSHMGWRLIDNG